MVLDIIDPPIETTSLCKLHREANLREERFVERFETFILGGEFYNSYTELNDPVLQRELLLKQAEKRAAGDAEAHLLSMKISSSRSVKACPQQVVMELGSIALSSSS